MKNLLFTLVLVAFFGFIILSFAHNMAHNTGGINLDAAVSGLNTVTSATCDAVKSLCQ